MHTEQLDRLKTALANRYRLERELGAGGMATVYLAEDLKHGRKVALKVLRPDLAAILGAERFLQEVHITAGLDHPHILTLIDSGASDGFVWYVVPYVRGESLRQKLNREKQLPIEEALAITRQVASALEYAHRQGVIHRDLKPENILLFEGEAMLADFGIALALKQAGGQRLTETGISLGTPQYMSPEQATGDSELDARADVYSLGAVLYEMLAGEPPHTGPSVQAIVAKLISERPTNVRVLRPTVPVAVEMATMKALATHRADRFPNASGFIAALDRSAPTEKQTGRYRALGATAAVLTVSGILALVFTSSSTPRVTAYTQLTISQVLFAPAPSPFPLVTDGSRIYFDEFLSGRPVWRQMSQVGGEMVPITLPFEADRWTMPQGMTPDRSHVVFGVYRTGESEGEFWLWPVVGGSPRRLGDLIGHGGVGWSADGGTFTYVNGRDIYVARADGTQPRKLLTAPGRSYWPAFSPDGSRIRFTAFDPKSGLPGLWEASADGSNLHPVLPGWSDPPNQCCGSWTPDGEYYVFQATRESRSHIWAIREQGGLFGRRRSAPIQLTTGATDFIRPLIAPDGKRIFAIGWQLRGELVRYDTESRQFAPYLSPLSAEWLAYSKDAESVVYVTYPEAELWRSKSDGTNRLQLTFPPMRARTPAWTPDGRTIAFVGHLPGQHWKIYVVAANGGTPRALTPDDQPESSPTWSADGASLAFSVGGVQGIRLVDVQTGKVSTLEGSDGLHAPRWSPSGQYLAAHSTDHRRLLLLDVAARRWQELLRHDIREHDWSGDGQYLQFDTAWWVGELYRVRISDGSVQRVAGMGDVRRVWGVNGMWAGLTPDGSPLLLRDLSIHHIYALDWEP